jgi:solute carrier family 35, member F5
MILLYGYRLFSCLVHCSANYTYNASLQHTSITSSTVLASTGSLFTFLFAVTAGDELFGWIKLGGILLGFAGSLLTTLGDSEGSDNRSDDVEALWGDLLGLISAVGYGAYAVQTRLLCPHDESIYSMQLILGYIGLIDMIALAPIAIYQVYAEKQLSMLVFGCVVLKGLFDNVISDYLWLRSVILTNATIATVGLGLTIPMAFASDIILGTDGVITTWSIVGAMTVMIGFLLVNVGDKEVEEAGPPVIVIPDVEPMVNDIEGVVQMEGLTVTNGDGAVDSKPAWLDSP